MRWYSFYPYDYLNDTLHLSLEEDCVYRRLIDHYMTTEHALPDNDQALATIARIGITDWQRLAPNIKPFFRLQNGKLTNARCMLELSQASNRRKTSIEKARKAAKERWRKNKALDATSNAPSMLDPMPVALRHSTDRQEEEALRASLRATRVRARGRLNGAEKQEQPNEPRHPKRWIGAEKLFDEEDDSDLA
jgi:uncharacterized protein YdaU (DUF1376 family)